jgi:hypothetical protein
MSPDAQADSTCPAGEIMSAEYSLLGTGVLLPFIPELCWREGVPRVGQSISGSEAKGLPRPRREHGPSLNDLPTPARELSSDG